MARDSHRLLVGYKRDGYFQNLKDVQNKPRFTGLAVAPGDIAYKDKNGDGVIDDNDRYVLGNPFPHYIFGFTYSVTWKDLDLGLLIQGVGQRDMGAAGRTDRAVPCQLFLHHVRTPTGLLAAG